MMENKNVVGVLYWLINATTPYETNVRLDYLDASYPRLHDYLQNLRRLQPHWTSWSCTWELTFGTKSSAYSENLHSSVKGGMILGLLINLCQFTSIGHHLSIEDFEHYPTLQTGLVTNRLLFLNEF